jgi:hypothetical protein
MPRFRLFAAGTASVLAVALLAAWSWWPSEAELAQRVAALASRRLGVGVQVGALHWQLLPRPQLELREVQTEQPEPVVLQRLRAEPRLLALLQGRVVLERLTLDGARIPQRSLAAWKRTGQADGSDGDDGGDGNAQQGPEGVPAVELAHLAFDGVTWISHSGVPVVYAGEAELDADQRLRQARLWRPGVEPPADIRITREDPASGAAGAAPDAPQRFGLQVRLAGGTAQGWAQVASQADGRLQLTGALSPRGVEVQAALAAFNRRSPVAGRADGETQLAAEGAQALELAQRLRTDTRFTMAPATVLGFDLQRTIDTLGREHAGQTRLERLGGRVQTQNVPQQGMAIRFDDLHATAGRFSARGSARLQQRRLQAVAAVDLVDGVVGVPMRIEGPLGRLQVTVSKAPLVGAAAGTAVLPGIGTAIGAAIGRLLGGGEDTQAPPAR